MPSARHKVLKITTTSTFAISHHDELNPNFESYDINTNRAVLEKMLP